MKTVIDTKELKRNIDLVGIASRYTELRKATAGEYHGACPWCGGDDRFVVTPDRFFCREGNGHCGRNGDAIQFVMLQANVGFQQACAMLSGGALPTADKVTPTAKAPKVAASSDWDEPTERRKLLESHALLMDGKAKSAAAALAYLQGRGLELATLAAFNVGYNHIGLPATYNHETKQRTYPPQLAVALPWFDRDGALMAVKFRFTEKHNYTDIGGKERTESKTSRGLVVGRVFGWQALQGPERCNILIVCEGEMNALSLWQVGQGWIDVLSTGTQGMLKALPDDVIELANRYECRIVWADEAEKAAQGARQIGATPFKSPYNLDANDLLQQGVLSDLVHGLLGRLGVKLQSSPLPPMRRRTSLPALPVELWVTAATFAEAWREWQRLKPDYFCTVGKDGSGFHVRADPKTWRLIPPFAI